MAAGLALLLASACSRPGFPVYPDGQREFAYVANSAGNTVTILDLVYLRQDRTIPVGVDPVAIAANPERDEVYVVNSQPEQSSGSVSVIDTKKNAVVATIPVRRTPTAISVDKTGQRAFVVDTGSNAISEIDLNARRVIANVATGEKPKSAAIAPDGRTLVVTNQGSGGISLYSILMPAPATAAISGAPPVLRASFNGCPGASDAVILPDSKEAFVTCSSANQVMAIWLAAAADASSLPQDVTLVKDHVMTLLDVGRNPTNLTMKPDGGEIFVSNRDSDSVSEISTWTNEVGSTYAIGNRPAHGAVSSDNSAFWVSNLGAESISLYSIVDGKFVSSVRTGMAPDALVFSDNEQMLLTADTRSGDVAVIRTSSKLGPALFTILPAGGSPSAIAVKAMP
jgi:YVTN family beta-propeller protein